MNAVQAMIQDGFLQAPWVERIGWTLLHSLWQITVIAVLYALAAAMFRKQSAKLRYLSGCVALLAMICFPVGTYLLLPNGSGQGTTDLVAASPDPSPNATAAPAPLQQEAFADPSPLLPAIAPDPAALLVAGATPDELAAPVTLRAWLPWATAAWLLGVCLLSMRPVLGWLHVRRLQRHGLSPLSDPLRQAARALARRIGVTRAVRFVQSTLVEVPTVVGFLRPIVLLPASAVSGLSMAELEMILAHELAHIRRHDYVINLGQAVLESLLFFHPAMWWVSREVRRERENCCDDIAVAVSGNPEHYVLALTRLEEQRTATNVAVLAATGGSLLNRVRRLLGQPSAEFGYRSATAWLAGLIAATMVSLALATGGAPGDDAGATPEAGNPTEEPGDTTPESDRDSMLAYARALAAGDFETLAQTWELQDDLDRQFARRMAGMFAGAPDMDVDLISMQRMNEDTLFACFLMRDAPVQFGKEPSPHFVTFHRKDDRWRCPPIGNLRSIANVRSMGAAQFGRRAITQQMIAARFSPGYLANRAAHMKAQRDAFTRLSRPPYNLDDYERVAKHMTDGIKKLESEQPSWKDLQRLMLEEHGKEALPQPADFYLSFYLEAKDDPKARKLPVANKDEFFPAEPFPCLTEESVLKAGVEMSPNEDGARIGLTLTEGGAKLFGELTRNSIGKRIAIVIDGKVVSAPAIQAPILGGKAVIAGDFSKQEAEAIAKELNAYREQALEFLKAMDKEEAPDSRKAAASPPGGPAWGEPSEGVRARLTGAKRILGRSDWGHPVLRLRYDVKNDGARILHLPENGERHQVEVDGRWYEWVDSRIGRKDGEAFVSHASKLLDLEAGQGHARQTVELAGHWRAIPQGKESEYAARQLSGYAAGPDDYGEELVLAPGHHEIRVAVLCPSARADFHGIVRAVSNTLTVELDALSAKVTTPAESLRKAANVDQAGIKCEAGFIPEKSEIMVGEAIYATFYVKNTGPKPIYLETGGDGRSIRSYRFEFSATEGAGHPARDPHPDVGHFGGLQGLPPEIKPGETYSEKLQLAKWIAFDRPGDYTVRGTRTLQFPATQDFTQEYALVHPVAATFRLKVVPRSDEGLAARIAALGQRLRAEKDENEARLTAQLLTETQAPNIIPDILWAAEHWSGDSWALHMLAAFKDDPRVMALYREALRESRGNSRRSQAARLMGESRNMAFLPDLLAAFGAEDDKFVLTSIAAALGQLGNQQAIPILKSKRDHAYSHLRLAVEQALVNCGETLDVQRFQAIICSTDPVWHSAAIFVADHGGTDAPRILAECLDFEHPEAAVGNNDANTKPAYRNGLLLMSIHQAGGPSFEYNQIHNRPATDAETEHNRRTLDEIRKRFGIQVDAASAPDKP